MRYIKTKDGVYEVIRDNGFGKIVALVNGNAVTFCEDKGEILAKGGKELCVATCVGD